MKVKNNFDIEFELPDSDSEGYAIDGQQPRICIFNYDFGSRVDLIDLIRESISDNPNKETAIITADWLRSIADDITPHPSTVKE